MISIDRSMEKHGSKSGSFIGRHRWRSANLEGSRSSFSNRIHYKSPVLNVDPHLSSGDHHEHVDHHKILADLDAFTYELSTADNKITPPELPDITDAFYTIIKSKTRKSADDAFLFESVERLCKLRTALGEFSDNKPPLCKVENLLHKIMMFMEEQLGTLVSTAADSSNLDDVAPPQPKLKTISSKHFSFKSERERCPPRVEEEVEEEAEDNYPGFSDEDISRINKIVRTMISAGYRNECLNVYSNGRGNVLYEQLKRLDFEKLKAEDVQKLNWDWLEPDILRWIRIVKHFSQFLIPAERRLIETIFDDGDFRVNQVTRSLITSLLDYAATVVAVMKPRSAERLFKFLDMYEALQGLREAMMNDDDDDVDYSSVTERIGEGVVNMFGDLEKSIRQDVAKTPVPGGAVHPLTRYVLNYLKYACDYRDTLEQIFQHQNKKLINDHNHQQQQQEDHKSPLAAQIASVMSLLDGNLAVKSTLYKDPSLRDIFMMNNGRYILQKVKGSNEIKRLMGDNWCRRRSSEVRHYHKSYQRETWARLLQCITQEGIITTGTGTGTGTGGGKVNKQVLKERFKNFNNMFDEIHKTQTAWVVSDDQLQSELRASISAVVIPAYRSFVGRYKHHFEAGKNMDKYIKYQPEDIEAFIETLFEGTPHTSMSRKRF